MWASNAGVGYTRLAGKQAQPLLAQLGMRRKRTVPNSASAPQDVEDVAPSLRPACRYLPSARSDG
jgi:hypothetical protein